jgi:methyl-accepting chemotaxis protein
MKVRRTLPDKAREASMKLRLKIGSKVLLTGGITILAVLLTIFIIVNVQLNSGISKLVGEELTALAESMADYTDVRIKSDIRTALAVANNAELIGCVEAANSGAKDANILASSLGLRLKAMLTSSEFDNSYNEINAVSAEGKVVASSTATIVGVDVSDRDYFKDTMSSGKGGVSPILISKVDGSAVVLILAPVKNKAGKTIGIVSFNMKTTGITDEMAKFSLGKSGYFFVFDKAGLVVQHPDETVMLKTNITTLAGMETISKKALSGSRGYDSYVFKGVKKIGAYSTVPSNGWVVMPQMTASEFLSTASDIERIILIVGSIALAAAIAVLYALSRSISDPIGACVKYAGLIESGDLSRPVRAQFLARQDEIGDLAQAFKGMVDKFQAIVSEI